MSTDKHRACYAPVTTDRTLNRRQPFRKAFQRRRKPILLLFGIGNYPCSCHPHQVLAHICCCAAVPEIVIVGDLILSVSGELLHFIEVELGVARALSRVGYVSVDSEVHI